MNDTISQTPPTARRNGSATSILPADELANAFLSLGRLLSEQYPERYAEAAKELEKFAPVINPWRTIQGDLDNSWGRELSAAILREREAANNVTVEDGEV